MVNKREQVLENKREQIKKDLERFVEFLNGYTLDQRGNLDLRLPRVEKLIDEFEIVQNQLEEFDKDGFERDRNNNERKQFENVFFSAVAQAKELLPRAVASTPEFTVNRTAYSIESKLKLPTLRIPEFHGNYENFGEFRDLFTALVHENENLSDAQKFYYLTNSLKGDAARVIQNLEITDANYATAFSLVKSRYENKKLTVNSHIRSIMEIPAIAKDNHVQLRVLSDTPIKNLRCLKGLNQEVDKWDSILIYIISEKLDAETKRAFTSLKTKDVLPTVNELIEFLDERCTLLETLNKGDTVNTTHKRNKTNSLVAVAERNCPVCNQQHSIHKCERFLALSVENRVKEVKRFNLCFNCLYKGHGVRQCRGKYCLKCKREHNTLLHDAQGAQVLRAEGEPTTRQADADGGDVASTVTLINQDRLTNGKGILSTTLVKIRAANNCYYDCRVLLDCASERNYITAEMCRFLRLKTTSVSATICGIGSQETNVKQEVRVNIQAVDEHSYSNYSATLQCLVIEKITENIPVRSLEISKFKIPNHIHLADPKFYESRKIDLLIGCDTFWSLLGPKQISIGKNMPLLQQTRLGYVVAGPMFTKNTNKRTVAHCSISSALQRFWQIEEIDTTRNSKSGDESKCEELFRTTARRTEDGRFIVKIPIRENAGQLGDCRELAVKRLLSVEKRLSRDSELKQLYTQCMNEYFKLDYMREIDESRKTQMSYYLTHHPVIKIDSLTHKFRIVYNASMKTDTNLSLNDIQYVGPTVQSGIFEILVRFRKHRYAFSSDIQKMYNQILIDESQHDLQRVLWRENPNEPIKCFVMRVVSFGLSSSPYLATRCLLQLGIENEMSYPVASDIIKNDYYIDDLVSGADTVADAIKIRDDVISILQTAKFELRKWISNEPKIVGSISRDEDDDLKVLSFGHDMPNKTLGVLWNADADTFKCTVREFTSNEGITKRVILSTISQIYDPLGLVAPVVMVAKILMQSLWKAKVSWDEVLPKELQENWIKFRDSLHLINQFRVPRHVLCIEPIRIELHSFSDASLKSFAACTYLRSVDRQGNVSVKLLCSKSRVAPIRSVTIPRLELCGAVLAAKLAQKVETAMKLKLDARYFWCDSTIVLAWLRADASRWKIFVANRVATIQELTRIEDWRHVGTNDNAADIITRGMDPKQFLENKMWQNGPEWLLQDESKWPCSVESKLTDIPDSRNVSANLVAVSSCDLSFMSKLSDLGSMQRIMAYCLRFINNCKANSKRVTGLLSAQELDKALLVLIKISQRKTYAREINDLSKGREISGSSNLANLHPFVDDSGLLRVGGRLQQSELQYERMHQVILPHGHPLSELVARYIHVAHLHCGPQALLAIIREIFWPVAGRNLTRKIVHNCVRCFRAKPKSVTHVMGQLPKDRVVPTPPFYNCGVDFGGPYSIRDKKTRGAREVKCYISLFVCFSTKAIHLELVGDLTAQAFVAALRRFISRRGKPNTIYSDNATNFIGANNEIRNFLNESKFQTKINHALTEQGVEWKFIPSRSPHFGGLWEGGIKSVKYHLKRTIDSTALIYEEFNTLLVQIEAILNSRPLSPLSSHVGDLTPLTPGHFLIGRPLTALADEKLGDVKTNRLERFQRVQQATQQFWKRWSQEYLQELQRATKWQKGDNSTAIRVGSVVLVKEDNLPICKWVLARVSQLHPGPDGVARVATIRLPNHHETRRAVRRLCVLPVDNGVSVDREGQVREGN